ncbi:hypothetical protein [Methanospirillum lacunae]|uniref:DUF2953 domain-containing protein n=1 Tax=Methanospirillum lacunae TaxID=668570 RepID=A0A2V2N7P8_9EURY|nr:hypothetical protein [Methanospirillum lacunae]PWR72267.1 hypothetical protein DK846_09830 [Methanospirillum lacunae]
MLELIISFFLIVILLFFFGGVTLLIYCTPVIITFTGVWRVDTKAGSACIRWGPLAICISPESKGIQVIFKIRRTELYQIPLHRPSGGDAVQEEVPTSSEEKKPEQDLRRMIPFISLIKKIIPLILTHIRIERITGSVKFGSGDPVSTGLVYGYYQALAPVCRFFCSAILIPVFDQLTFEADLTGGLRIEYPAGLIIKSLQRLFPEILPLFNIKVPGFISGEASV